MFKLLKKIIVGKQSKSSKKVVENIKEISVLSDEINVKKQHINELEFSSLLDRKDEIYISLSDFLEFFNKDDIDIGILLSKYKHISEILNVKSSTIDVYTIVEDDHVVLCPDVCSCQKHKKYKGDKIKITTVKR